MTVSTIQEKPVRITKKPNYHYLNTIRDLKAFALVYLANEEKKPLRSRNFKKLALYRERLSFYDEVLSEYVR